MRTHYERGRALLVVVVCVAFGGAIGGTIGQLRRVSGQVADVADQVEQVETQTRDWSPLGPYPDQTVDEVRPDAVKVTGTKCFDPLELPRVAELRGSVTLISQDGDGVFLPMFNGARKVPLREPACTARTFVNELPVEEMAAHPNVGAWRIVGVEVPIDVDGNEGVPATWRTEPFAWPPTGGES